MVIVRTCEQCGASFAPRREHARFCSARCRVAWNTDHRADHSTEVNALAWSTIAMTDATDRLQRVTAPDRRRAFTVIGEAVWWVTIVDATLVRYHPDSYDQVLGELLPDRRVLIEETLAGLRFVRNQMGQGSGRVDFIQPQPGQANLEPGRVADWTWNSLPEPDCAALSPDGKAWEIARYRAYQARLARHAVGESFACAAEFLKLAAAGADQVA